MKRLRLLAFVVLVLGAGLPSCQCSEKPDIGPVEDEEGGDEQSQVVVEPPRRA